MLQRKEVSRFGFLVSRYSGLWIKSNFNYGQENFMKVSWKDRLPPETRNQKRETKNPASRGFLILSFLFFLGKEVTGLSAFSFRTAHAVHSATESDLAACLLFFHVAACT